jgi:hypothetical protein
MDRTFYSVPLQLIFRGVFPGGFFVLSYAVATYGWRVVTELGWITTLALWVILAAAVFFGVVIYTLHRSAIYPWIEELMSGWIAELPPAKYWRGKLISREACRQLIAHWTVGGETKEKATADIIGNHNTAWNDYIHLQYASTICIALGALCGYVITKGDAKFDCTLFWLGTGLWTSAWIADLRRRSLMDYYFKVVVPTLRSNKTVNTK